MGAFDYKAWMSKGGRKWANCNKGIYFVKWRLLESFYFFCMRNSKQSWGDEENFEEVWKILWKESHGEEWRILRSCGEFCGKMMETASTVGMGEKQQQ
jgi:hypothetical protein